jgi:hypothetical protein
LILRSAGPLVGSDWPLSPGQGRLASARADRASTQSTHFARPDDFQPRPANTSFPRRTQSSPETPIFQDEPNEPCQDGQGEAASIVEVPKRKFQPRPSARKRRTQLHVEPSRVLGGRSPHRRRPRLETYSLRRRPGKPGFSTDFAGSSRERVIVWWVPAGKHPVGSDNQGVGVSVKVQRLNRCSAGGCESEDAQAVLGPSEMLRPALLARMEQRDFRAGLGLDHFGPVRSDLWRLHSGQLSQRFNSSSVPPLALGTMCSTSSLAMTRRCGLRQ